MKRTRATAPVVAPAVAGFPSATSSAAGGLLAGPGHWDADAEKVVVSSAPIR